MKNSVRECEYIVILEYQDYTGKKVKSVLHDGKHVHFFSSVSAARVAGNFHCNKQHGINFEIKELLPIRKDAK